MARTTLVVVATLLASLFGAATSLAAPGYVAERSLTPLQTGAQSRPSIWQDTVVYEDDSTGDWDVYAIGFADETAQRLATGPGNQRRPVVSGDWVAYEDDRNGNLDVYAYQLSTQTERQLTTSLTSQGRPVISGDLVAYQSGTGKKAQVYVIDLTSGERTRLTPTGKADQCPSISGKRVALMRWDGAAWDIWVHDFSSRRATNITRNAASQGFPSISGSLVAYEDYRSGYGIRVYSLSTKRERLLSSADPCRAPVVSGDGVVYARFKGENWDLMYRNAIAGPAMVLTDDQTDQVTPALAADKLVWTDLRGGTAGVYAATLAIPYVNPEASKLGPFSYGADATISCRIGFAARIWKYVWSGGLARATTASGVAEDGWEWSIRVPLDNLQRNASYRLVFKGDATHLPAVSQVVKVRCRAWLSKPVISRARPMGYVVSGYLKPRHRAGGYPVKLLLWAYAPSWPLDPTPWRLMSTRRARASNYGSYTKYSLSYSSFMLWSKWYIVAVHEDADHAKREVQSAEQ